MKLTDFIKECGTQEKAAQKLGVTVSTVNRWIVGKHQPSTLAIAHLKRFNIVLDSKEVA